MLKCQFLQQNSSIITINSERSQSYNCLNNQCRYPITNFFTKKEKSLRNTQEGQLTIGAKKFSGVSCRTIHLNSHYFQKKHFCLSSPFPPTYFLTRPPQIHSYLVKLLCNHSKYNIILLKDMESKIEQYFKTVIMNNYFITLHRRNNNLQLLVYQIQIDFLETRGKSFLVTSMKYNHRKRWKKEQSGKFSDK